LNHAIHRLCRCAKRICPARAWSGAAPYASLGLALPLALAAPFGSSSSSLQIALFALAAALAITVVLVPLQWLLYGVILAIPFDNLSLPVGPLGISVSDALLVVLVLRWLLVVAQRGGRIARSEIYAPATLFFALLLPSFLVTSDYALSARHAFAILMMLTTALVATNLLRSEGRLRHAVTAFMVASAVISLLALAQLYLWLRYHISPFQWDLNAAHIGGMTFLRLTGTYVDPNWLALYLIGPIVLGLFVALEQPASRRYKAFVWAALALDTAVFLMTFSRGGWVTLLAFMVVFVLLRARAPSRGLWLAMVIAVLVAAPLLATMFVEINPSSVRSREVLQELGAEVMTEHPLAGTGLGTFKYLPQNPFHGPTHSIYLQIGADAGIPPLVAFLWLGLVVMVNAVRALRVAPAGSTRAILVGSVYALGCIAIEGAFLDALIVKYLWVLVGIISAAAAVARADHSPEETSSVEAHTQPLLEQES